MGKILLMLMLAYAPFLQTASEIVSQLGSDDPDAREAATAKLIAFWENDQVCEMVGRLAESSNPEVSARAGYVHGRILLRRQLGNECASEIGEEREKELYDSDEDQALQLFANVAGGTPGYRIARHPSAVLLYLAGKAGRTSAKIKLLNLIAAFKPHGLGQGVKDLINDPEDSVALSAIYAASELGMRELCADIVRRTGSKNPILRKCVSGIVARLGVIPCISLDFRRFASDFFRKL